MLRFALHLLPCPFKPPHWRSAVVSPHLLHCLSFDLALPLSRSLAWLSQREIAANRPRHGSQLLAAHSELVESLHRRRQSKSKQRQNTRVALAGRDKRRARQQHRLQQPCSKHSQTHREVKVDVDTIPRKGRAKRVFIMRSPTKTSPRWCCLRSSSFGAQNGRV